VLKAAPNAKPADLTHTEGNELRKLGETASLDELLYVLRAFLEADALLRESPHPRVELEIATVRATRRPVPQTLDDLLRRVDEAQREIRQRALATPAPPAAAAQTILLPGTESAAPRAEPRRPPAPASGGVPPARPASPAPAPPVHVPSSAPAPPAVPAAGGALVADTDLSTAWERVVDEVMKTRPTLAAVLTQARPSGVSDRELTIVLLGNHFHREMLADAANRELVVRAVRRCVAGAERVNVVSGRETTGAIATHPAVQAAIAEFQGEVVAVRPRLPEGEGQ